MIMKSSNRNNKRIKEHTVKGAKIRKWLPLKDDTHKFINNAINTAYQNTISDIRQSDTEVIRVLQQLCTRWRNHLSTVKVPSHTCIHTPRNATEKQFDDFEDLESRLDQAIEKEQQLLTDLKNVQNKFAEGV